MAWNNATLVEMPQETPTDQPNLLDVLKSDGFRPRAEEAEAKLIPHLPETRPYPLLHYTWPGAAAKAMRDGLDSIASAKEAGHHIADGHNWQGERLISVTDLEEYIQEQQLQPDDHSQPVDIAREAMGMGGNGHSRFWSQGGACLLINPAIESYYGGQAGYLPRDQIREELLGVGQASGDTARYGGGYPGEAVVPDKITPEDIHGIVLSSYFTDSDIAEALEEKVASLATDAPNDYLATFNDEINLLGLFGLLDADALEGLGYVRGQYEKAAKLHHAVHNPTSFANLLKTHPVDDQSGYVKGVFAQQEQQRTELEAILSDPVLQQQSTSLLEASRTLVTSLKQADISSYSELITSLAKIQGIPVYDNTGEVVWPKQLVAA
jgi:hypothetical protein